MPDDCPRILSTKPSRLAQISALVVNHNMETYSRYNVIVSMDDVVYVHLAYWDLGGAFRVVWLAILWLQSLSHRLYSGTAHFLL